MITALMSCRTDRSGKISITLSGICEANGYDAAAIQPTGAVHKLEENFLSKSAVQVITYGDVRDTIVRLMQTKECLENAMSQYEKYLEFDARAQDLLG